LINLSHDEIRNDDSWSKLWTSSCAVGQPIRLHHYAISSGWIQGKPTLFDHLFTDSGRAHSIKDIPVGSLMTIRSVICHWNRNNV